MGQESDRINSIQFVGFGGRVIFMSFSDFKDLVKELLKLFFRMLSPKFIHSPLSDSWICWASISFFFFSYKHTYFFQITLHYRLLWDTEYNHLLIFKALFYIPKWASEYLLLFIWLIKRQSIEFIWFIYSWVSLEGCQQTWCLQVGDFQLCNHTCLSICA